MSRKIIGGVDNNNQRGINFAPGTNPSDVATMAQLDQIARGLDWKNSVRVSTTANITLSGLQTIDGVSLVAGDRVLVKDQTTASANGIYIAASGSWTRATDYDDNVEVTAASAVPVESGTVNADTVWLLATDGAITIGTTALSFTRLGGAGVAYLAGNGLLLNGSTFSVNPKTSGGIAVDSQGVYIDPAFAGLAKRYAADVPSSASPVITHNLGTKDVVVQVIEVSSGIQVDADVTYTSVNAISLSFPSAPAAGFYRVVIVG